jgi:hypothetical protein
MSRLIADLDPDEWDFTIGRRAVGSQVSVLETK